LRRGAAPGRRGALGPAPGPRGRPDPALRSRQRGSMRPAQPAASVTASPTASAVIGMPPRAGDGPRASGGMPALGHVVHPLWDWCRWRGADTAPVDFLGWRRFLRARPTARRQTSLLASACPAGPEQRPAHGRALRPTPVPLAPGHRSIIRRHGPAPRGRPAPALHRHAAPRCPGRRRLGGRAPPSSPSWATCRAASTTSSRG
jgi:hypothetical protein